MRKIQIGSDALQTHIEGWENTTIETVDIRKTLPYQNDSIDFIMAEHVIEHVTQHEVSRFFTECYRVLKIGGVARIIVPDFKWVFESCDAQYLGFIEQFVGWENASKRMAAELLMFGWGHQSFWTPEILTATLNVTGFKTKIEEYNKSNIPELNNIDRHWIPIGMHAAIMESLVVEATK